MWMCNWMCSEQKRALLSVNPFQIRLYKKMHKKNKKIKWNPTILSELPPVLVRWASLCIQKCLEVELQATSTLNVSSLKSFFFVFGHPQVGWGLRTWREKKYWVNPQKCLIFWRSKLKVNQFLNLEAKSWHPLVLTDKPSRLLLFLFICVYCLKYRN